MAEIGIIASIIGVAGAGFRLSLILNAVGCEVASAGIEIHSIAKSVSLFALILKQVGATLQESDSIHSAEAVDTAKEIAGQCERVFDEISEMLDKVQKKDESGSWKGPSLAQKFKWCFKKGRVQYLLAQLESLKLSLVVMMQILHLGKLMAPNRQPIDEGIKSDKLIQERAEVQNMVVVRYWTISKLDRLYEAAELEADGSYDEKRKSIEASPVESRQLALEAPPPDYNSASKALIKAPIVSFYELDASMSAIKESPKEMLRVSGEVIEPLLNRWTRLPDLQEQAKRGYFPHSNSQDGNYPAYPTPHAYEYYETDEEDSPPSPVDTREKGYYLEGTTTDWRKPHSTDARRERSRRRREYSTFQPSIDSDVSEEDVKHPKKARAPTRHVIDSDDESEPERDQQKPRRSSDGSRLEKAKSSSSNRDRDRPRSYTPGSDARAYSDKYPVSPRGSISSVFGAPRAPSQSQQGGRPLPTPAQVPNFHHSVSSPPPPIHGRPGQRPSPNGTPYGSPYGSPYAAYNALNPVVAPPPYPPTYPGQYAPGLLQPQSLPQGMSPQQMHAQMQQQQQLQQRGQLPPLTMPRAADIPHVRPSSRHSTSAKSPRESREFAEARERRMKEERKKEFKKGATKGILGGVGIATFLEALEGLSI